ncbi:MAG: hypothetical protein ACJAVV_000328 [Alphaproteobacteria bacterium]|jgi:hypothetical protein
MGFFTNIRRQLTASRFKRNNLSIIESIQPTLINTILAELVNDGWELAAQFDTPESLNSQGQCIVRRGQSTLSFSLKHDSLGAIVGPSRIVSALAREHKLVALTSPTY